MELEFDVGVEDARVQRAYRRGRLEQLANRGFAVNALQLAAALAFAAAAAALYLAYRDAGAATSTHLAWSLALLGAGAAATLALLVLKRRRLDGLLAGYERQYPVRQRVSVTGRGLDLRNSYEHSHVSWRYIAAAEEHADYVALVLKSTDCLLIPKAALGDDDDVADFIDIVREKSGTTP